jgi:ribose 5-phosphate isomerase B
MKRVVIASDHAGFELKAKLRGFIESLGLEVEDIGPHEYRESDDYPDYVGKAAREVSQDPNNTAGVVIGGSGQGEAVVANRFPNVRAVVYYGEPEVQKGGLNMLVLTREHNDANVLSLGARFLDEETAKRAIEIWLQSPFPGEERHARRIKKIEEYPS